jgi:crossover junction endodeoxyribonuclease RuvC
MNDSIILGIDPALANLGWGVIRCRSGKLEYVNSGTIKNRDASEIITSRLAKITLELERIILEYNPSLVAMEESFINKNAVSSLKLGYARGAIMALIGRHNLNFLEYKPNMIKKIVTGTGHATKDQILYMIKLLIPGIKHITDFDEADALAVAYTSSCTTPPPALDVSTVCQTG